MSSRVSQNMFSPKCAEETELNIFFTQEHSSELAIEEGIGWGSDLLVVWVWWDQPYFLLSTLAGCGSGV